MPKRSAIIIVCNGEPFVKAQLNNIYNLVDEIIIMEGADKWFQKVIKSPRSTDGTIKTIKEYPDPDNKITLVHVNYGKNRMVREANMLCTGDYIYQVDIDEFIRPEHIEHAFKLLEIKPTVGIPQRWYYKWPDVHLNSGRPSHIRSVPVRFFRNLIKDGLVISHIPCHGYYRGTKHVPVVGATLPMSQYAYHYLAVYAFQLENKMKYYCARDGVNSSIIKRRLSEFESFSRKDIGKGIVKSYNGKLILETNPFMAGF